MYEGQRVAVIIPCLNEEKKIQRVLERLNATSPRVFDELIVVDDGSTDRSAEVARNLGATVISLGRIEGVGAALRSGFGYAVKQQHDLVVVMAGNDKDEPNEIPLLLEAIVKKGLDFVQGSRFLRKSNRGHMPVYRRIATRVHPILFSICVGKRVTESTNGFRAFRIALLGDPNIKLSQEWLNEYELEPYLYYKVISLGYRTGEVPCTKVYPSKKLGYTKMKPITGWWSILRPLILLKLGLRS